MSKLIQMDQSAFALRLYYIEGEVPWNELHPLKECNIKSGGLTLKATIIGASHVLSVGNFNEVFACCELNGFASDGMLAELSHQPIDKTLDDFGYSFSLEICRWEDWIIEEMEFDASRISGAKGIGLVKNFPETCGRIPKTIIIVHTGKEVYFTVKTLHSYPNEETIVITKTKIKENQYDV